MFQFYFICKKIKLPLWQHVKLCGPFSAETVTRLSANSCFPASQVGFYWIHQELLAQIPSAASGHFLEVSLCFQGTLMKLTFLGVLGWGRRRSGNRGPFYFLIILFSETESSHNQEMFHLTSDLTASLVEETNTKIFSLRNNICRSGTLTDLNI